MKPIAFSFFAAAWLALPAPAFAQTKANYAECGSGGCTCTLAHIDLDEYAVATGMPAPEGAANMTLVAHEGEYYWSSSSFEELDMVVGGDGICTPQLFNIVPMDGLWQGSVRVQTITGCPPQAAQMVPPLVAAQGYQKQIEWGGVFHPSQFVLGASGDRITWRALNAVQFDGEFPIPPNPTLTVTAKATATLTAPDKAEATLALRMTAANPADAAALAIIGMADCRVDAVYDFNRVGP